MKWVLTLLASMLVSWPSVAQHGPGVSYEEVVRLPLALKAKSSPIRISYAAVPGKGFSTLPEDMRVEVVVSGQHVPVAMSADGTLDLPLREDWIAADARLVNNQPFGRTTLTMHWNYQWPQSSIGTRRLDLRQLHQVSKDFDSVLSNSPTPMKLSAWVLIFEAPGTEVRVESGDGRVEVIRADAQGRLQLPVEALPADGLLQFGSKVRAIVPLPVPLTTSHG